MHVWCLGPPALMGELPPCQSSTPEAVYTVRCVVGARLHQPQVLPFLRVPYTPLFVLTSLSQIRTPGLFAGPQMDIVEVLLIDCL